MLRGSSARRCLGSGDPLSPSRVDPYLQGQADAVRAVGAIAALIDHETLMGGDAARAVRRVPQDIGPCWYRGWMIPAARYAELEHALAGRGAHLLTGAAGYQRAHELPAWGGTFADVTPESVWRNVASNELVPAATLAELTTPLGGGPAIVKDFVKSRKHEWDEACYVSNVEDVASLHTVVSRFIELQGDDLTGGMVIRAFELFAANGPEAGEARDWWLGGAPILVGPHPDSPDVTPKPRLAEIHPLVQALGCRFITTDIARHVDGRWRVVEIGDGQVSDLPRTTAPDMLLSSLVAAS